MNQIETQKEKAQKSYKNKIPRLSSGWAIR